jgi:crotonobetainyl-CoA:carnitine CoA-transferase CaiB-like acyl-CoA transferase
MAPFALKGVRVLDLTMLWAGPMATRLLGDMGAEVIKIESCTHLDPTRVYYAPKEKAGEGSTNWGGYYHKFNYNKLGLTLNLNKPKGQEVFKKLVKISDIVLENFSSRVMKNFGLDYEALRRIRADLIMVSMPAFGTTGPYGNFGAWGTNIEGASGLSASTGYRDGPPMRTGIAYGDPLSAYSAALAMMAALHYRSKTGKGQFIDISQAEALSAPLGEPIMDFILNGRNAVRQGNRHPQMAPHGCYRCRGEDKWVTIAVSNEEEWKGLCKVMGHPSWTAEAKYASAAERLKNQEELNSLIEDWTRMQDPYEVMGLLQGAGVPSGAVLDIREMVHDPQVTARQFFQKVPYSEVDVFPCASTAWRLSKTPAKLRHAAPFLGQHNQDVLGTLLGLSPEEIAGLEAEEIIGTKPKTS